VQKHLNGNNILNINIMSINYRFSISEVSKISNFSNSAINYYIRMELITPPKKTSKTRALFSQKSIDELNKIRILKGQGMPIRMIKHNLKENSRNFEKQEKLEGTIKDVSSELGISQNWLKQLLKKGIITSNKSTNNQYILDPLEVQLVTYLKALNKLGVPEEYLVRHCDYKDLSEAEAIFLLEHINFSSLKKEDIKNIKDNYEKVRNIFRSKEFNNLLN
tara:strand:+ start:266 stop:925 length:660 start_codon:yes stop_codon:yes gene_type:complete